MCNVVYYSAGVGRTGTFIALDHLLDQAKTENMVDVFNTVYMMRSKRVNMVQTQVGAL
jgi:protein tyrosine phosphatase